MSATAIETNAGLSFTAKAGLAAVIGLWFALAAWAGVTGILSTGPDQLARPVLLSVRRTMRPPEPLRRRPMRRPPPAPRCAAPSSPGSCAHFELALTRRPEFARSRRFVIWHPLGLLDFVVAAGTARLASGAIPGLVSGPLTSAPMEVWPLSLFPSFIVPLFVFLHLSVLFQVRALIRATP